MHSRDYVYVRRSKIFHRHRVMALISQATSHPRKPESRRHVRVKRFSSKMVVKPFTSFDEVIRITINWVILNPCLALLFNAFVSLHPIFKSDNVRYQYILKIKDL